MGVLNEKRCKNNNPRDKDLRTRDKALTTPGTEALTTLGTMASTTLGNKVSTRGQ